MYTPAGASQAKRDLDNVSNHLHKHAHGRSGPLHKRQMTSAEINGVWVTWGNNDVEASAIPSGTTQQVMVTATIDGVVQTWVNDVSL